MRRKIQRRQQGRKSEENSYLTKLDPNTMAENQYVQQPGMIQSGLHGRYLHSMGGTRPTREVNQQQMVRGG